MLIFQKNLITSPLYSSLFAVHVSGMMMIPNVKGALSTHGLYVVRVVSFIFRMCSAFRAALDHVPFSLSDKMLTTHVII